MRSHLRVLPRGSELPATPPLLQDDEESKLFSFDVDEIVESLRSELGWRNPNSGKTVYVSSLRSPRFRLRSPLPVFLEEENGQVTAVAYDIGQYAVGVSEHDAISDLCSTIVEYFLLLSEGEPLSSELEQHRRVLNSLIEDSHANQEATGA